jgi:hypothetical protein
MRTVKSIVERDGPMWRELCPMLEGLSRALASTPRTFALPVEVEPVEVTSADAALVAFEVFQRWSMNAGGIDEVTVRTVLDEGGTLVTAESDVAFIHSLSTNMQALSGVLGVTGLPNVRRHLPPCGAIESAHCDATWGNFLIEFKSVRRAFSVRDLRQVILYGAMFWADGRFCPEAAVVANPLSGTMLSLSYQRIASVVSGRSFEQLTRDLADHLVGLGISG